MHSGRSELGTGLFRVARERLAPSRFGLDVAALAAGSRHFLAPVHVDPETPGLEELLACLALVGARDVRGRDREEMDRPVPPFGGGQLACGHHGSRHTGRSEEVHLDCGVERRVEADGCRRVHDDVAFGEAPETLLVEAEPVLSDVTGDRGDPRCDLGVEGVPAFGPEPVEAVVPQDLPGRTLQRAGTATRSDQEDDLAVGNGPQETLHQGGTEKPGAAGDEEPPGGQASRIVTESVYHMVSGRVESRRWIWQPGSAWASAGPVGRSWRCRRVRGAARPSASSTRRSPPSPPAVTTAPRSTRSPLGLEVRKQTILYWFPSKEVLLEAVIDRSVVELSAAMEGALGTAGTGWARVEAVVRSVFSLAARRPELLGLVREVSRLGTPASTRFVSAMDPLVRSERRSSSSPRWTPVTCGVTSRDCLLLAIYSTVIGMVTEVEVLRAFGEEPTARSLVRRRAEILELLRSALLADPT